MADRPKAGPEGQPTLGQQVHPQKHQGVPPGPQPEQQKQQPLNGQDGQKGGQKLGGVPSPERRGADGPRRPVHRGGGLEGSALHGP